MLRVCGLIGHGERFCKRNYENAEGIVVRRFGPEVRAMSKRNTVQGLGQKWLWQQPLLIGETPVTAQEQVGRDKAENRRSWKERARISK